MTNFSSVPPAKDVAAIASSANDTSAKDMSALAKLVRPKPAKALLARPATLKGAPVKPQESAQGQPEDSKPKGPKAPQSGEGAPRSVWRAAKPAKRPTWLKVNKPRSANLQRTSELKPESQELKKSNAETKPSQPNSATPARNSTQDSARDSSEDSPPQTPGPMSGSETPQKAPQADEPKRQNIRDKDVADEDRTKKSAGAMATLASPAVTGVALTAKSETTISSKTQEASGRDEGRRDKPAAGYSKPNCSVLEKSEQEKISPSPAAPVRVLREGITPSRKTGEAPEATAGNEVPEPSSFESTSSKPPPAMDFVRRVRQDLIKQDAPTLAPGLATRSFLGFLDLLRGRQAKQLAQAAPSKPARTSKSGPRPPRQSEQSEMAALSPNDLRHYVTQRISASDVKDEWDAPPDPHADLGEVGPVLGSLDEVIDTVLDGSTGGLPRTMLVAGTSSRAQSPQAAIAIARSLADCNEQVALVDLAKGAAVVSGQLNMPRVPGFADLAAGWVDFLDVVKIDEDSTLQVIPAGNPMTNDGFYESDKFMRVFEALTQTYDCVILHADMAAIESLMPALKFELPVAVAILPPRGTPKGEGASLSIVQRLGCPIVIYGTGGKQKQGRFSLFGRKVVV